MLKSIYRLFLISFTLILSQISFAKIDDANFKFFIFEICNSDIQISESLNIPFKEESARYNQRLKRFIQNVVEEYNFKAVVIENCSIGPSTYPVIRVNHSSYEYYNFTLFQITINGFYHPSIDGLDAKFTVDGVNYQSKIPILNKNYADMIFQDPIGLSVENSDNMSLGSGLEYASYLQVFKSKLVLAASIYSGKSAWDLALKKIDEIYTFYNEMQKRRPSNLDGLLTSEDIAYITAKYIILKDRGEPTDIEKIKKLNIDFKFSAIFYYLLIYEYLQQGMTKNDLAENLISIGWIFSNPHSDFENLLYQIAGIERKFKN